MKVKIKDNVVQVVNAYYDNWLEDLYYGEKISFNDILNYDLNRTVPLDKEYELLYKDKEHNRCFIREIAPMDKYSQKIYRTYCVRADEIEECGIKVGDFVNVIDTERSYPLFEAFFNKYNLNDYYKLHWMYGKNIPNGKYCVKFIGEDCEENKVCLIENNMCEVYLISEDGLEKIEIREG